MRCFLSHNSRTLWVTLGSNIILELFVFSALLPVPVTDLKAECERRSADKNICMCFSGYLYCSRMSNVVKILLCLRKRIGKGYPKMKII